VCSIPYSIRPDTCRQPGTTQAGRLRPVARELHIMSASQTQATQPTHGRRIRRRVTSNPTKEAGMALARVVTFDGVSKDRMDEMGREMQESQPPEGFPPAEIIALHDADAQKSVVVIVFDNEDDYRKGDEILNAMPTGDTPGQRTSVTKYDVAVRMKS